MEAIDRVAGNGMSLYDLQHKCDDLGLFCPILSKVKHLISCFPIRSRAFQSDLMLSNPKSNQTFKAVLFPTGMVPTTFSPSLPTLHIPACISMVLLFYSTTCITLNLVHCPMHSIHYNICNTSSLPLQPCRLTPYSSTPLPLSQSVVEVPRHAPCLQSFIRTDSIWYDGLATNRVSPNHIWGGAQSLSPFNLSGEQLPSANCSR